jgi:hypothetical protein
LLRVPDLVARYSKENRGGNWQLPANAAPISAASTAAGS